MRWAGPLAVLVALVVGALQVGLPYYALAPGEARQVDDLIKVPGDRRFPPRGDVLLSTVSIRRVTALEALTGWLDPNTEVVPEERILGTTPRKQFTQQNIEEMDNSKQNAAVVALRRLGYTVTEHGKGALVVQVDEAAPAHGHLVQGDVVTAVDGKPTPLVDDLVGAVRSRQPGDIVHLDVTNAKGESRTEDVTLGRHPGREGGYLGVVLKTKEQKFDYPFDLSIDSGAIGGPSAGLAFTLGVLDVLTPGELTGGQKIAATGTIDLDGTVGDVGGVVQKTAAVRKAGAKVFLVPPGEYREARAHAGRNLEVVKVSTLDEALAAIGKHGGDVSAVQAPKAAA
ncbi:MAG TPA: PDZ domain-containing protein [Acidimicrobiales bacterium]|nr:PDZ domain-containing protein [Acidimicrobiales bacterium]